MIVKHTNASARRLSSLACRDSLLSKPSSTILLHRGPSLIPVRHASHGSAGRANGPKNGPGKRLGAKKTGDQWVIPGNIIFRQRGAEWQAGDNVGMGRDHTIYALESGYVRFYRDPSRNPKKRYIGVVLDREDTLPAPPNAPRRRRLNRIEVPIEQRPSASSISNTFSMKGMADVIEKEDIKRKAEGRVPLKDLRMREDYSFRETNWDIGRAAERAGVSVPKFKPHDRFAAWRKRTARRKIAAEKRNLGRKKPSSRKVKN